MKPPEKTDATRRAYFTWLAFLSAAPSLAVAWLWTQPQGALPEPLAAHWGLVSGAPDGSVSRAVLSAITLALGPGCIAAAAWSGAEAGAAEERPRLLALAVFLAGLSTTLTCAIVQLNTGASHWQQARPNSLWATAGALGVLAACARLAHGWAERAWPGAPQADSEPPDALKLEPDERVFWSAGASSRWLLGLAGLLAAGSLTAGLPLVEGAPRLAGVFPLLAALLMEALSKVSLRLNHKALQVRLGHFGWLHHTIALTQVQRAEAISVRPLSLGGWGYRGIPFVSKRVAIVVRGGDALQLTLRNGKRWIVTVDDAHTGARVLNGLLQQTQPSTAPGGQSAVLPSA